MTEPDETITELIERSSFGTAGARTLRERTPIGAAQHIVDRAAAAERTPRPTGHPARRDAVQIAQDQDPDADLAPTKAAAATPASRKHARGTVEDQGHHTPAPMPPGVTATELEALGLPSAVVEFLVASAEAAGISPGPRNAERPRHSRPSPDRVQRSFYLSRDLVDRARAAVLATMHHSGEAYNVSQLAGRALENEVLRLERDYNNGKRFPPVSHVPSKPSREAGERNQAGVTRRRRKTAESSGRGGARTGAAGDADGTDRPSAGEPWSSLPASPAQDVG